MFEVKIKEFCYSNPQGGTMLSDGMNGPAYPHPEASVKPVKGWYDYEIGWRFIGEVTDPQLDAFITQHGHPDRRIFFGEFDLLDRRDLGPLIDFANQ